MYNETGRNTTAQGKAPFVSGDIHSNRIKPGGRLKQPFALCASLLVPLSWILGSVKAECGCTPTCIARRNAAAQSCARPIRVYPILPTKRDRTDGQIDKDREREERKERKEREKERESRITCRNVCQHLPRMAAVKVYDIVKVVSFDSLSSSKRKIWVGRISPKS